MVVKFLGKQKPAQALAAFTLVEMLVVITIIAVLVGAGISLIGGTGVQSRKAGADMISGMVDQARTLAITTRSNVYLVIAEPGTLQGQDERCRLGLLREITIPPVNPRDPPTKELQLVRRWQTLNSGVVLIPGDVDGVPNALIQKVDMIFTSNKKPIRASVYQLAINSLGSLTLPEGSRPVVLRLAEGAYRNGSPSPNKVADGQGIAETQITIGRVIARPYRSN